MIATGRLDIGKGDPSLPAMNRWTPWKVSIDFEGFDLSGGTFRAQWRRSKDQTIPALIDLQNTTSPAEGISVSVVTVDGVPKSTVEMRVNETTIEGLPFTSLRGGNIDLVWDIHITATGIPKWRALEGDCPVKAGSTQ